MKRQLGSASAVALVSAVLVGAPAGIEAAEWHNGDVFAAISFGRYAVFDKLGVRKDTIDSGVPNINAGCAFNPDRSRLYTTNFATFAPPFNTGLLVHDAADPHPLVKAVDTGSCEDPAQSCTAESVVFRADGSYTVGHDDGDKALLLYDANDALITRYFPPTDDPAGGYSRGTDWHDTSVDQGTVYYTSENHFIRRFDILPGEPIDPDEQPWGNLLASGPVPPNGAHGLRLLPPGDGSGGLLVAVWSDIRLLDSAGETVLATYPDPSDPRAAGLADGWFAISLDPDGASFWAASQTSFALAKFDIGSRQIVVGPVAIDPAEAVVGLNGLCVLGELLAATNMPFDLAAAEAYLAIEVKKKRKHRKPQPEECHDKPPSKATYGKKRSDRDNDHRKPYAGKSGYGGKLSDRDDGRRKPRADKSSYGGKHSDRDDDHHKPRMNGCDDEESDKDKHSRKKSADRDRGDYRNPSGSHRDAGEDDHHDDKPRQPKPDDEAGVRTVLFFHGTMDFGASFESPQDVVIDIDSSTQPANAIRPVTIPAAEFTDDGAGNYVATVEVADQQPLGIPLSIIVSMPKSGAGEFVVTVRNLAADLGDPPVEATIYIRIGAKTGRAVVVLDEVVPNRRLAYPSTIGAQATPLGRLAPRPALGKHRNG